MALDIAAWLRGLDLEQYAGAFAENDIDDRALPVLTADDLKDLGVVSIGHRRRLLEAIAAFPSNPPAAPAATEPAANATEAERRQLTVMFCDIVGSTALSTQFDPEDLRDLINGYHRAVADTVARFDGFVAKYMGDGVLIYFGYPRAHEDDAERSIRAGLATIEAVSKLTGRVTLRVRIGIATGLAVVGDLIGAGAAQERGVVGETPNLAARVQGLAEPNTIVIADSTRRQVGGLFDFTDLGPKTLAGFAEPQHAWRVLGESGTENRFEALRSGETPLVGRDEDVALLIRRWSQAKGGEGRVVLISGEPGIGKSRLTAALSEHVDPEPHTRLRYFCSPHHQDSAFYPVIGHLERAAGFARDDTTETKCDKLTALLGPTAETDDISLLAELLSLPGGDRFPPLDLSPPAKKQRTFAALLRQLETLSQTQAVLAIFEDLHWIDPTSREFLDVLLARIDGLAILLVATFRPEFQPPWTGPAHVSSIALNRLGRGEGAAMVRRLVGNAAQLPPDVVAEIVERTDGVPLFVEEMTKAVLEAGTAVAASVPATGLGVPATLQASLMARLDRLGAEAKSVAQIGAAIGREFSYELAAAAGDLPEDRLRAALLRLADAGLVFQRGAPPAAEYLFKHALVQDAAYGTLLRRTRQQLHARIAAALEARFPDRAAREPEALARHFSEAQQPERAVDYWLAAGRRSLQRSANQEAIGHLTAGLAQLEYIPETAERTKQELALQRQLGQAYFHVKGLGAPETGRAFGRARDLCVASDDDPNILPVLQGIVIAEWGAGRLEKAKDTAAEMLRRAARTGDTGGLISSYFNVAASALQLGELAEARSAFEMGIGAYRRIDPATALRIAHDYSIEMGAFTYVYAGWCWWLLGYPDQARGFAEEAIAAGERVRHDYSRCRALYCKSVLHAFRREWALVEDCAAASIALARERGLGMMVAVAGILLAIARGMREPDDAAVADIRRAIDAYRATGTRLQIVYPLVLLAQVLAVRGQSAEGLAVLRDAETLMNETSERMVEAEIHRVKGDLLLTHPNAAAAEACYVKALAVARAQGAGAFELRAATSLARLWKTQGRQAEAKDLLAPVHGRFVEGFDTADLTEAAALLGVPG